VKEKVHDDPSSSQKVALVKITPMQQITKERRKASKQQKGKKVALLIFSNDGAVQRGIR
jgi:hypothetical protein